MNAKVVFTAEYEWFEISRRDGMEIDSDAEPVDASEWDSVCELCGFDIRDPDVGFMILTKPREEDTALKPGDIIGISYGEDVVFLRPDTQVIPRRDDNLTILPRSKRK